ncbi:MAG: LysR family transcriptional regulator [Oscillospiraceae bacterium]|nr:LysR family transcriptional regulator [Oscillospiraceae bacterium]
MSLKKFEAAEAACRLGSLKKAAAELGYTQSGISHMISGLEQELGVTLLTRSKGGAGLTQEGARLMPMIREMLAGYREILGTASELSRGGVVKIGAFTSVAVNWLPGIIRMYREKHPEFRINMMNGDYNDVNIWLNNGEIDLGFIALPGPEGCRCVPLAEDPLSVVLPAGHRLCGMDPVPIGEVAKEPLISLLQASSQDVHRALDRAGVRPEIRYTTKDDYAIIAMVREGLGVSIMPELLLKGQMTGVAVRRLSPPAFRTIALAVPEGKEKPPAVRCFEECVIQWLSGQGLR